MYPTSGYLTSSTHYTSKPYSLGASRAHTTPIPEFSGWWGRTRRKETNVKDVIPTAHVIQPEVAAELANEATDWLIKEIVASGQNYRMCLSDTETDVLEKFKKGLAQQIQQALLQLRPQQTDHAGGTDNAKLVLPFGYDNYAEYSLVRDAASDARLFLPFDGEIVINVCDGIVTAHNRNRDKETIRALHPDSRVVPAPHSRWAVLV